MKLIYHFTISELTLLSNVTQEIWPGSAHLKIVKLVKLMKLVLFTFPFLSSPPTLTSSCSFVCHLGSRTTVNTLQQ